MKSDMTYYWEKDVTEMMSQVKKIHEKLSKNKESNIWFEFNKEKYEKELNGTEEGNLRTFLREIQSMDAVLKDKVAEEKEAKLSRIQAEEDFREILDNLTQFEVSNAMKNNFEGFLGLLNETEKTQLFDQETEMKRNAGNKDENKVQHQNKPATFVERNIQLAKCGRGVLSLTDEEKMRIKNLLTDIEVKNSEGCADCAESKDDATIHFSYFYDEEAKMTLNVLDKKLEVYSAMNAADDVQSNLSFVAEERIENKETREQNNINEKIRLKEINKLLDEINSICDEEIRPLPAEEIAILIQEAKQSYAVRISQNKSPAVDLGAFSETITELIINAKSLMPKFKYRFNDV